MVAQLIRSIESEQFKENIPQFGAGDTVRVHAKVVEGSRERIQMFEGVVIRRRSGGINENFTVRRIASHGIGVERTFLIHSPRIEKIELTRPTAQFAFPADTEPTSITLDPNTWVLIQSAEFVKR